MGSGGDPPAKPPGQRRRYGCEDTCPLKVDLSDRHKAHVMSFDKNDQADRAISTSKLHASRHFHTWPINVVVYHGSRRSLVLRLVSRLDAFSGYLFHTELPCCAAGATTGPPEV